MKINNRRYIGCKTKLLEYINKEVEKYHFKDGSSFVDLFAGTGVVAYYFAQKGYKTIVNDLLYSNYVVYKALLGKEKMSLSKIDKLISKFNSINSKRLQDNYFSKTYGNKYFSINDAKKIGYIRDEIETNKNKLNKREYFYLISCLIYSCDKIANTVGHYESFLKTKPLDKNFILKPIEIDSNITPGIIYNSDANLLSKKINADIVYLDPPYNARQYVNFYHVLENLARWNKPTVFEGNSMKFKRNELKSNYCRKKAPQLFDELIKNLKCKLIIVSYSNTYKAGSISSVNTISPGQILDSLKKKGNVIVKKIKYPAFNSGKTDMSNHKEILYICEVDNES